MQSIESYKPKPSIERKPNKDVVAESSAFSLDILGIRKIVISVKASPDHPQIGHIGVPRWVLKPSLERLISDPVTHLGIWPCT